MYSFVTKKENKQYLGIATKIKHSKKSMDNSNNDEFTFSPNKKKDDND
jgi:hypothetical protein